MRRPSPPPSSASTDRARAERKARALEEPLDVRVRAYDAYPVLEVRNPVHRTTYLVLLPEFPAPSPALCTCTDFARRGLGTCKHLEAAIRWMGGHPDARPPPGRAPAAAPDPWPEIDRRAKELPLPERLTGRALARPGAVLFA